MWHDWPTKEAEWWCLSRLSLLLLSPSLWVMCRKIGLTCRALMCPSLVWRPCDIRPHDVLLHNLYNNQCKIARHQFTANFEHYCSDELIISTIPSVSITLRSQFNPTHIDFIALSIHKLFSIQSIISTTVQVNKQFSFKSQTSHYTIDNFVSTTVWHYTVRYGMGYTIEWQVGTSRQSILLATFSQLAQSGVGASRLDNVQDLNKSHLYYWKSGRSSILIAGLACREMVSSFRIQSRLSE